MLLIFISAVLCICACCSDFSHLRTGCVFLSAGLFFFFLMQLGACRAGSGRAGPGSTHRLHVILQGGVWLKGLFPNSRLQQHSHSWAPLTKPRLSSLVSRCTFGILTSLVRLIPDSDALQIRTMGDAQSAQREGKKDAAAEEESGKVDDALTEQAAEDKVPSHLPSAHPHGWHTADELLSRVQVKLIHTCSLIGNPVSVFCVCVCVSVCVGGRKCWGWILLFACQQMHPDLKKTKKKQPLSHVEPHQLIQVQNKSFCRFLPCWNCWKCVLILTDYWEL